jgi:uncharacterized membrane protein
MKNFSSILLSFLLFWTLSPSVFAYYTEAWEITSFHSEITIDENADTEVIETIDLDFTNESHRGIERSIPYKYENGRNIDLDFIKASNPNGEDWKVKTFKNNGYFFIQMTTQDDDQRHGKESYQVSYVLKNVINFFDTHDEFYWNVNGNEWVVTAQSIEATVNLPGSFKQEDLQIDCFTGSHGETRKDCSWELTTPSTIEFQTTSPLVEYENLSIVVGLEKGILAPPTGWEKIKYTYLSFIIDNLPILLIPFTLIGMTTLWYKKGRDDQSVKSTVIPHYVPPENLTPSEVGTIIDEKVDPKDITATIIEYAIKGNILITEVEEKKLIGSSKDYQLEIVKILPPLRAYEKLILDQFFPLNQVGEKIKISKMKNKFYKKVEKIRTQIFKDLIKKDYFPHDPSTIRSIYLTTGGVIAFISFNIMGVLPLDWAVGLIVSAGIIALFSKIMPRKTRKGTEVYYQLKGLYEYIDTAEKDRLKFQEDNLIMFEKLLPYAVAFGIAKKWAKAFDGLLTEAPSWFNSATFNNNFAVFHLVDSLDNFSKNMVSDITSKPSGSGGSWSGGSGFSGGFSGGGFGGGGGRGL